MKNTNAFKDFLHDEVNLNQSRLDGLEGKIESVTGYLKKNLEGYRKYEKQGSYAMQTIIKPVKDPDEYDADLLIYIEDNENLEPKDYIDSLFQILNDNGNYSGILKRRTRCITLDYSGDVHIDLVPCIERNDKTFICNSKDNAFEESDGTGYRRWLSSQTVKTKGELKRVTRLMKYLRDHKKNFSVKSILLTTLLGNSIDGISSADFTDTPTALLKIVETLHSFLEAHSTMPEIKNPVLFSENFNRQWDQNKYENFRSKIATYNEWITDAYNDGDHNSSVRKWRKVFGESFGKIQENSSVSVTPRKPHCRGW